MKHPILIDLDGVLRVKNNPAEYLNEFLEYIRDKKIPACILSNSSTSTSKQVKKFFETNNIELSIPIITAIDAAKIYVTSRFEKVAVFVSDNVVEQFSDCLDFEKPEAVLIGDIGDSWNYRLMQTIFEYIRNGAKLIAAHKNKFWEIPELGIQLDAGPFIHAIEYATSEKATLIGKPSPIYFESALVKIGSDLSKPFLMLGDDLDTDIAGSKNIGGTTILIYTGKTKPKVDSDYESVIDYEADDLSEVITILDKIQSG